MSRLSPVLAALVASMMLCGTPVAVQAQMRGHGGPVRAIAVSRDGQFALSGSFDQTAILWALEGGAALAVWRFHDGAVNAVAALPDGRFATGGEDGRIALWRVGATVPARVIADHTGPIAGLAVNGAGTAIASASWDGTARVTPLDGSEGRVFSGHEGNVNGVAFLPDQRLATAGYDGTLRLWPPTGGPATVVPLPAPLNSVATAPDGEIVVGSADGTLRILDNGGRVRTEIEAGATPVVALAVSPDGTRIAAAVIAGSVTIVERASGRVLFSLVGPGLPVWSLAFTPDGRELLTGGSDRLVRRWDMRSGEPIGPLALGRPENPLAAFAGDRGAEMFQACAACHTLTPDGGNRAGPTLHGIFGRRIATLPDYPFSPALRNLDIVWNEQTISKLFEIGPSHYTPGTKMPEQTITNARDREALVRFLERATR